MEEDEINAFLPDEMLQQVFSFLPPLNLKSSVLVCKRWTEVRYDKKSDEGSNSVRMRPENSGALKVVKK